MNNVISSYVLDGKVLSTIYDDSHILCEDKDEDGFFNWGVGPKPDQCPPCPDQPDGDDSDPCLGPMDAYGHMAPSIPLPPRAKNLVVGLGEPVPPLHASGKNIKWFADSALTDLVYTGNDFNTGKTAGRFTYYATQSSGNCESHANKVTLVIAVPPPLTSDTEICIGEKVIISAIGENIKWYVDSASVETDPRDGQTYNTIIIRDQKWMTSNLNYAEEGSEYYLHDSLAYHQYGRLYTWTSALEACPDGWNLPGDSHWKDLEKTLGMSQEEANKTGDYRGTTEGNKLKEAGTAHWLISPGNTNESGLSVLPGGEARNGFNDFLGAGTKALFWTVSSIGRDAFAYARELSAGDTRIARIEVPKENGLSVRCIKGSEGLKLITAGSDFMPRDTMPGIYNYYVSQEIEGMESERKKVQLNILPRNFSSLPDSIDICAGMQLPPLAYADEQVSWYDDPLLNQPVNPGNSVPGNYKYYVTRGNICATGFPEEVNVLIRQLPCLSLGKDTTLEWQEKVTFDFEAPYLRYEWNTGTTSPTMELHGIELGSGKHSIWLMVTDTNNCTNTDTLEITVLYPTIVPGIEPDKDIILYPNPGSGEYHIRLNNKEGENIRYVLTDETGSILVLKQIGIVKANEQLSLDISHLPDGIYFIRITGNKLLYSDKIIKAD